MFVYLWIYFTVYLWFPCCVYLCVCLCFFCLSLCTYRISIFLFMCGMFSLFCLFVLTWYMCVCLSFVYKCWHVCGREKRRNSTTTLKREKYNYPYISKQQDEAFIEISISSCYLVCLCLFACCFEKNKTLRLILYCQAKADE